MVPCENKTFLIVVRTTCDVQTLHFKNREGKLELQVRISQKCMAQYTYSSARPTRSRNKHINQVSLKSVVRIKWVCKKEGQKHYWMDLYELILML